MEIAFLLSLHGRDLVRSPQIPRRRLSLETRPRKGGRGSTPTLLTIEYLRFGGLGEAAFNQLSHAGYLCGKPSWKLSPSVTMPTQRSKVNHALGPWLTRGPSPREGISNFTPEPQHRANALVQSGEDYEDGGRTPQPEPQRPEIDCCCEREHWTGRQWIFFPLGRCAEVWAGEGHRVPEAAQGCTVAMPRLWLHAAHQPCLTLVCWVKHLVSELYG